MRFTNFRQRIISVLIALIMVLSIFPFAFAVVEESNSNFDEELELLLQALAPEEDTLAAERLPAPRGVTITADAASPTGFFATFVYHNPAATLVELAGHMGLRDAGNLAAPQLSPEAYRPGLFPASPDYHRRMTSLGGGYWTVTIPLPGGGIPYWYRVYTVPAETIPEIITTAFRNANSTRVFDPYNRPPVLPVGDTGPNRITRNEPYSVALVPWSDQQDPRNNRNMELPRANPAERGEVRFVPFAANNGPTDWGTRYLGIYLPPGFDIDRAEPFPVIYVTHGMGGDQTDWMWVGGAPNIMDNLIAEGKIRPTVIVSMNQYHFGGWGPANTIVGPIESQMYNIMPFVEENFNVSSEVADRAYVGLSFGGALAVRIYAAHANQFGYFAFLSTLNMGGIGAIVNENIPHRNDPCIFVGHGIFEGGIFTALPGQLTAANIEHSFHSVPANHDQNAWSQLFTIFARDYVWQSGVTEGVTINEDPASPTGLTATFVYRSTANATRVVLAGDLTMRDINEPLTPVVRHQPEAWRTGRYHTGGTEFRRDMVRVGDSDYWTVTIPLHAGGLSYWYRVWDDNTLPQHAGVNQGTRVYDPTSTHVRPTGTTTFRAHNNDVLDVVYVPYHPTMNDPLLESRARYEMPRENPAERGTVQYIEYTTMFGDSGWFLGVYLPPCYDPNRAEPYPVIYLGHGVFGDETDWMIPGNVPVILDNLIARGEIEPMVVVTAGAHFTPGVTPMHTSNVHNPAHNFVSHVLPFIEGRFNVSDQREGRAYAGFSMGTMTGGVIIDYYYEYFGYFGFFAGNPNSSHHALDIEALGARLGDNVPFVMLGLGMFEGGHPAAATNLARFNNAGIPAVFHTVPSAHDMMTAGMLFTIFARDYLWQFSGLTEGVTINEDPASPTGLTATFVYKSTANARRVALAGDLTIRDVNLPIIASNRFQPEEWQLGRYSAGGVEFRRDMARIGSTDYWTVTIPVHAGGLSYWYRVWDDNTLPQHAGVNQGTRIYDPTSTHVRPPADSGTIFRVNGNDVLDVVYVPYHATMNDPILETRAIYEMPRENPAERGTVKYVEYKTVHARGVDWPFHLGIYLPPCYDPDRAEPYRVLYLLHGIMGDETDWMIPGNVPVILDNMFARGEVEPFIVVTVGGHFNPTAAATAVTPFQAFGTYTTVTAAANLVNRVLPFVEDNFNVSTDRLGRAMGGFSMGSMTAGPVLNNSHDMFGYFGLIAGNQTGANAPNFAQIVAETEAANGSLPAVFIGYGVWEGAAWQNGMIGTYNAFTNHGFLTAHRTVPGGHDMMAASMAFTIFARDFLWQSQPNIDITNAPTVLRRNTSVTLGANVAPATGPQDVIWTSSNPALATVNAQGVVTARVATGIVIITARTPCGQVVSSVTIRLSM